MQLEQNPLANSFEENDFESALKSIFFQVINESINDKKALYESFNDANVLGNPYLGSLDLIKRAVNNDGLLLLDNNLSDSVKIDAYKYIYKAWRGQNYGGRGLSFLKTYLKLLFPSDQNLNVQQVKCSYQDIHNYPSESILKTVSMPQFDADIINGTYFLTNRLKITLSNSSQFDIAKVSSTIASILPAKYVPYFKALSNLITGVAYYAQSESGLIESNCTIESTYTFTAESKPITSDFVATKTQCVRLIKNPPKLDGLWEIDGKQILGSVRKLKLDGSWKVARRKSWIYDNNTEKWIKQ